jgi:cytochrome subunit of sulfide dehydrogenase
MKIQLNITQKPHKLLLVFVGFFVLSVNAYADENLAAMPHIQTLAASCAACHGSQGNSVGGTSVLAGLDASHFVLQMTAFRNGSRSSTVMHRHAKGLTVEEINDLAVYFEQQKRVTALTPPNQRLAE